MLSLGSRANSRKLRVLGLHVAEKRRMLFIFQFGVNRLAAYYTTAKIRSGNCHW